MMARRRQITRRNALCYFNLTWYRFAHYSPSMSGKPFQQILRTRCCCAYTRLKSFLCLVRRAGESLL